ncbi:MULTISPECIES: TetR/AcrR family transcriptional regulator [unclassified Pseudonocardia]|uniref:TetR/AcrR family transcriptional regulator n=1 Tax=unclassified Pseudonocardia TaxID=2619320 RepID=UPI0001FFF091|nr:MULTISPECIES: TetR/AcrR family transcriptional regulator [unclassified Pseudonocardia]ALE74317.1 TetR family transcriptional regulator [Pseudonocardia sp. EC080625-04]ALL77722.1 TetR family transcriptional regulator [Pseudonocardia sp. EC080610-09]ALL80638.1 TetR family transcriptional regulator [Pseudonocardia sp. EC080619-01]OLM17464.1 Transcriptional regulator, TetR family [Pseudonocardia sp. Ae707_Ps1]
MNARSAALVADTGRRNEAAILNAALQAFGLKGFNGASMRDVSKGAETSLSNLYNYFPSKSKLLAAVLRHANDELQRRVAEAVAHAGDDAPSRLREAVRAYVGFVVDHQVAMLVSTNEVRYLDPGDRAELVVDRDATQAIVGRIVAQGSGDGSFRTPYADDATRAILSTVGAIAAWYRPDGPLSRGQLAEQYARYAVALLEGPLPH